MKISQKLICGFFTIILLIGIASSFALYTSQKELRQSIGKEYSVFAGEVLEHIDIHIHDRIETFQEYSSNSTLRKTLLDSKREFMKLDDIHDYIDKKNEEWISVPKEQTNAFMQKLIDSDLSKNLREKIEYYNEKYNYSVFGEVFITNSFGANIAQTRKTTDYMQADEKWWQVAGRDGLSIEDVNYDESAGIYSISIGIKVADESGNLLGVIKVVINIEEAINLIKKSRNHTKYSTMLFMLVDSQGKTIYSTGGNEYNKRLPEEILTCIVNEQDKNNGYFLIENNGEKKFIAYNYSNGYQDYKGLGWYLLVVHEQEEIFASATTLRNTILIILVLAGICGILTSFLISKPISSNLAKLKNAAVAIGEGNLDTAITIKTSDEIGILASTFTRMSEQLKKTLKNLKEEISQRKQAEKSLKVSEERLRSLIQNIQAAVVVHGADTKIVASNAKAHELLGLTEDQLLKKSSFDPYWNFLNHDSTTLPVVEFPVNKVIATQQPLTDFILGIPKPDKTEIVWVLVNAVPIFEQSGKMDQVIVTFMDITPQKMAEEKREELLKELQEALAKVKTLSGFLPICASCKKIRDDKGYWNQIETYIRNHSEADFSHSICPECSKKLYPEFHKDE